MWFVSVRLCVVGCVLSETWGSEGSYTISESYRVEPNQPQGRTYHFQHYLTLCLKDLLREFPSLSPMTTKNRFRQYSDGKDYYTNSNSNSNNERSLCCLNKRLSMYQVMNIQKLFWYPDEE